VIVGGVLLVLLLVVAAIGVKRSSKGSAGVETARQATAKAKVAEEDSVGPIVKRGERSDEEILRQAKEDYQRGEVYFREAAVGDQNLWESINFYQRAEAELGLLDTSIWPKFAGDIPSKIQSAQGMLDQEYRRIKLSFVGYYQSADWRRADGELELLMRKIPDDTDPRYKWAKKHKAKVKKRLRGMPKKKGPL